MDVNNIEVNEPQELIVRKRVEDSPFSIITVEGKSFGVIGKNRITKPYDTVEEAENDVNTLNWDNIARLICIVVNDYIELKETINKKQK